MVITMSLLSVISQCDELLTKLKAGHSEQLLDLAERNMEDLKTWRQFDRLLSLGEIVSLFRPDKTHVRKLYAQGLLDTQQPTLARDVLESSLRGADDSDKEAVDAKGLLGRVYKDMFLAVPDTGLASEMAKQSLKHYLEPLRDPRFRSTYHGINAVAVLYAARERGLDPLPGESVDGLAKEVLEALKKEDEEARKEEPQKEQQQWPTPWWWATKAEAHIALEEWKPAAEALEAYIKHEWTSVFALGGTSRQFREIWRLSDKGALGRVLFQLLEAEYLQKSQKSDTEQGAELSLSTDQMRAMRKVDTEADKYLERILGDTGTLSIDWYRMGLVRAASVGAVHEKLKGRIGTCFVVDPKDFSFGDLKCSELLVLTNFHVVNSKGEGKGIKPAKARLRFEAADEETASKDFSITEILAESSDRGGQDYALLRVDAGGANLGLIPITSDVPDIDGVDRKPRVYLIGYPEGGLSLEFSLNDNLLLDHEAPPHGKPAQENRIRFHYFAPTRPGSSGCPVFNEEWDCIALHHAGFKLDARNYEYGTSKLNGEEGNYSANEGIWIRSVIEDARAQLA